MKYIKFLKLDLSGELVDALGSDSYIKVDGRWGKDRLIDLAFLTIQSRNINLGKNYVGFQIREGTHTDYINISNKVRT